mmetsp:Transcript_43690/g.69868  ORF Transcript_43690/g.69868 Transcript_43690/m.69868 type:complete len:370 (+) Transcript_43690:1656-2765(+)
MGNSPVKGCCQLRSAAQAGRKEDCAQLIKNGAKVCCQDNVWCSTALHESSRFGHTEIVSLLLKFNATVDIKDCIGQTPLAHAAKGGHNSIVQRLLEHGADPNSRTKKQKTPLHFALEQGCTVAALILLEHGACLDAHDVNGRTAFQYAAISGKYNNLLTIYTVLESLEGAQGCRCSKLLDLDDPEIPEKSLLVLKQWSGAVVRGKPMRIPPEGVYNSENAVEALGSFFGSSFHEHGPIKYPETKQITMSKNSNREINEMKKPIKRSSSNMSHGNRPCGQDTKHTTVSKKSDVAPTPSRTKRRRSGSSGSTSSGGLHQQKQNGNPLRKNCCPNKPEDSKSETESSSDTDEDDNILPGNLSVPVAVKRQRT